MRKITLFLIFCCTFLFTQAQLEAIAKQKMPDLNANSDEAAIRIIAGTARQMGIDVIED